VTETAGTAWVDLAERTRVTATSAAAAVRRWLPRLRERWGRSLQLRVIMTTLVLSAVVVSVLGYFLMQRFVSDLYASKLRAGQNVAQAGLHIAQTPPYAQDFRGTPGASASSNMKTLAYELATPSVGPAYSQTGTELAVLVTLNPNLQGQPVFGGGQDSGMDSTMIGAFLWNMLAWFLWGVLILALRYRVERRQQKIAAQEAYEALNS